MPTAGTHITILQRLAAMNPSLIPCIGDPSADEATPEGRMARFANLGAVGPDIFYALGDYGSELQDLENFLVKVGGTFQCIGELSEKLGRYIKGDLSDFTLGASDSIFATFDLISGVLKEGLLALVVGPVGANFWPCFESKRQTDRPRNEWFWADYLHYVKTGQFVRRLIENSYGKPNLYAYALGYLTHYVTDVVGHPFVNQVVQAPWRLYWQRHHLVENFIDVYVWDRWHMSNPAPPPPTTQEQPLDTVLLTPNAPPGSGAPFIFSRLHDLINIGNLNLDDPVDEIVSTICEKIEKGLFDIGIAEIIDPEAPADNDFTAWTELMATTIGQVYGVGTHPDNLAKGLTGSARPSGFPTAEDVGAAYGVMRLMLKISTEESIKEPHFPDITGDISAAFQKLVDDLGQDLSNLVPPFPVSGTDGSFGWDSLLDAIKNIAEWIGDVAKNIANTISDVIKNFINVGVTAVADSIKVALFFLNKLLFAMYRSFRDVLVLTGYTPPYTDQLSVNMGGPFNTGSLWRSMGNLPMYPVEEIPAERDTIFSTYAPFRPPITQTHPVPGFELPNVAFTAPYAPSFDSQLHVGRVNPTLPDDFIDAPMGPDNMFVLQTDHKMNRKMGPQEPVTTSDPRAPKSFGDEARNFGGAIANCKFAIEMANGGFKIDPTLGLPDYNLDGDRGFAWPCWAPDPEPAAGTPAPEKIHLDLGLYEMKVPDPLNPTDRRNVQPGQQHGPAHVNAQVMPLQIPP
ncbi:MAG: zinc dependent phospholipase C family protein [Pyrinomonadaceae bacterium]|nr:zinc dependent phospholipase C family protein [Phycisphaerales bacterium]